jgi:hypothetical protein
MFYFILFKKLEMQSMTLMTHASYIIGLFIIFTNGHREKV